MAGLLTLLSGLLGAANATDAVSVQQLKQHLEAGNAKVVVDVRTPGEYASGHVPSARNVPLSELGDRVDELSAHKGTDIYVICRSGSRSARGAALLSKQGFNAINVTGGTLAWQAAGFAVDK